MVAAREIHGSPYGSANSHYRAAVARYDRLGPARQGLSNRRPTTASDLPHLHRPHIIVLLCITSFRICTAAHHLTSSAHIFIVERPACKGKHVGAIPKWHSSHTNMDSQRVRSCIHGLTERGRHQPHTADRIPPNPTRDVHPYELTSVSSSGPPLWSPLSLLPCLPRIHMHAACDTPQSSIPVK